jgi:nucleotide-binding universal stress UspA family protein
MKILVAIDGSLHALAALASLIDRIAWFRDTPQLTLIHAHLPIPYKAAAAWVGHAVVAKYYDEESEAALASARQLLETRKIAFTIAKRVGEPAPEIVAFAESGAFDLIVMGTHGHTALANLVMGSVATKVLASSKVPLLFMR